MGRPFYAHAIETPSSAIALLGLSSSRIVCKCRPGPRKSSGTASLRGWDWVSWGLKQPFGGSGSGQTLRYEVSNPSRKMPPSVYYLQCLACLLRARLALEVVTGVGVDEWQPSCLFCIFEEEMLALALEKEISFTHRCVHARRAAHTVVGPHLRPHRPLAQRRHHHHHAWPPPTAPTRTQDVNYTFQHLTESANTSAHPL